jgi:iron complex outermembrane recepter protein
MQTKKLCFVLGALGLALIPVVPVFGQETTPVPAAETIDQPKTAAAEKSEVVALSPFTVTTDKDTGYRVTNSTSGTRLNTAIKDLPMSLQVLDSDFIADIGASDLRESLRYSASIQTTDWNTFGQQGGSFSTTPGKINNPEGATASASQTTVKFRGFETGSVLRDGFTRGNSTDAVNLERVELVSGPSSLLYGVSNFGGVVNYFVKQPQDKPASSFDLTYGSYNFARATFDVTGPIAPGFDYRITAAVQDQDSWTDFDKQKHWFVSPIFTFKPSDTTKITLDLEYGKARRDGIGWQDLRASPGYINQDTNVEYGFLPIAGRSPRIFRWSGPDTYNDSTAHNMEFKVEQVLGRGLSLWAGVDESVFNYKQLDNMAALQPAANFSNVPASDVANIPFVPLSSAETGISTGSVPSTITYQWENKRENTTITQVRADLAYHFTLFNNSPKKWLHMDNSFLVGYTYQKNVDEYHTSQTPGDTQNYHSPTDYSYIRFGTQSSGAPDQPIYEYDNHKSTTPDSAVYGVYQGKWLDNRLTVVAGIRHDRSYNSFWQYNPEFQFGGGQNYSGPPTTTRAPDSSDRTIQWGVSFAVTPELSVFGMNSGGVQPNYTGQLNDYGQPIKSTVARDSEIGIKFDLMHSRISGTVSWFTINRTRAPVGGTNAYWWAPTVTGQKTWDPSKNIVYMLDSGLDPAVNWYPESSAAAPQWNAAVTAGAIYQATNSAGNTNWYCNATKTQGAAYLDAVFAKAVADNQQDWFGWLYNVDNLTNNAALDQAGSATGNQDVILGSDRSSGLDGNLLFRPTDNLQIVFSWAYTKKVVVNGGQWVKYPYPQDRWAVWYDPVTWAGLQGKPINQVFTNPADTSTWIAYSSGAKEDDTPRNQGSIWANYTFPKQDPLHGLSIGAGASYIGPRQWLGGITPLGTAILDSAGNPINLQTTSMLVVDAMVRYEFKIGQHPTSLQFNVNNIANERRVTVPAAWMDPRTWRLSWGMSF